MELLTDKLRAELPKLGDQDGAGDAAVAYCKFFAPTSNWPWYVLEFDGEDQFFGLVEGFETELGYFSLRELEEIRLPMGLGIERDIHWSPTKLGELR